MDGGANCHVFNEEKFFIVLFKRPIKVKVALEITSEFDGVGISAYEAEEGKIRLLWPAYLSKKEKTCTLSPGAMKKHSGYKHAAHYALESLTLVTSDNKRIKVPVHTKNDLDYVKLKIYHFNAPLTTKKQKFRTFTVDPRLSADKEAEPQVRSMKQTNKSLAGDLHRKAMYLHIKFGHLNMEYINMMVKQGLIKGISRSVGELKYKCPICIIAKGTKIPRGIMTTLGDLPPGVRFHLDWMIVNTESCRGFKVALTVIDAVTRMPWGFPSRLRGAPIQLTRWFIKHMRIKGYAVAEFRVDEDSSLARSTEWNMICYQEGVNVESTGGYESTLNGKAERPHRTVKNMMRCQLIGSALPDPLWCLSYQFSILILRMRWNRMINGIPLLKWDPTREYVEIESLHIWGSKAYAVENNSLKRQLQARSKKDPRNYLAPTIDKDELPKHIDGYFVGYGGYDGKVLIYDPAKNRIKRCHHAYIDEFNVRVLDNEPFTPNATLLKDYPQKLEPGESKFDPAQIKIVKSNIELVQTTFKQEDMSTIILLLPPATYQMGLTFQDDFIFGKPVLSNVHPQSYLFHQIPKDYHKMAWIVSVTNQELGTFDPVPSEYLV